MNAIKEELMRFHFYEKWKYPGRRRFPWKLIVQLIVIILVTTQVRQIDICKNEWMHG